MIKKTYPLIIAIILAATIMPLFTPTAVAQEARATLQVQCDPSCSLTLVIEKSAGSGSTTSRIFFELTAPLDSTIKVGEIYTVTIDEIIIQGMAVTYGTVQTVTITIAQPTVLSIYNALDSYFDNIPSPYTLNNVPTTTDIMNLLDFRLAGEVQP